MAPIPRRESTIPTGAWITAGVLAFLVFALMNLLFLRDPNAPAVARVLAPLSGAVLLAGYAVLLGYIYGDARRRGMRYVAWTFLAALAPSAIGIILYFILRNPLMVHCTRCGCGIQPGFAYCPRCGAPMSATCRQCNRAAESGWTHCAWCGGKL